MGRLQTRLLSNIQRSIVQIISHCENDGFVLCVFKLFSLLDI